VDVNSNLNNQSPVMAVDVDRDKLAALGLNFGQVEDALQSAFSARQISTIYGATNQYKVILELAPEFQADPGVAGAAARALRQCGAGAAGYRGPYPRKTQALTVNHQGQLPSVTISFNLLPGVSLGEAVERLKALEQELRLPVSLNTSLQGTAQAFEESQKGLGLLLAGRRAGGLHRAGHPLRELRPPPDHPVRPALGRPGRPAHPECCST
jgi:HAE1 family hydrophobic/amphiphilic exporter-1